MSEVRKRSRKSKLEVRDDDCDYEVVNEENDETKPHLQVGVDCRLHFVSSTIRYFVHVSLRIM